MLFPVKMPPQHSKVPMIVLCGNSLIRICTNVLTRPVIPHHWRVLLSIMVSTPTTFRGWSPIGGTSLTGRSKLKSSTNIHIIKQPSKVNFCLLIIPLSCVWAHRFHHTLSQLPQWAFSVDWHHVNLSVVFWTGIEIHFIHVKPSRNLRGLSAKPLLMVHGWPGSFYEFYKIIPLLTDPAGHRLSDEDIVFEVICPSIPGYGFSEAPHQQGNRQHCEKFF